MRQAIPFFLILLLAACNSRDDQASIGDDVSIKARSACAEIVDAPEFHNYVGYLANRWENDREERINGINLWLGTNYTSGDVSDEQLQDLVDQRRAVSSANFATRQVRRSLIDAYVQQHGLSDASAFEAYLAQIDDSLGIQIDVEFDEQLDAYNDGIRERIDLYGRIRDSLLATFPELEDDNLMSECIGALLTEVFAEEGWE